MSRYPTAKDARTDEMPRSFGFWFDPNTGQSHSVTTHQDWLLDNSAALGLQDALAGLDRLQHEDQIRLIGVRFGLVRIRDYGPRMSVQFWAEAEKVGGILSAVRAFLPEIGAGPLKSVWINNLFNGAQLTMTAQEFIQAIDHGGRLFVDATPFGGPDPIP